MDPEKIQAVAEWPRPETAKEVQSFLGMVNFYRRFIQGFSGVAMPLTNLTKKSEPWVWSSLCESAFQRLKKAITTEPVLRIADPELPYVLQTDASDFAIGAVLLQKVTDGGFGTIAYYSRKLVSAERNYTVHDKELLAIVSAFEHWRHYLVGAKEVVEVCCDHKNLLFFQKHRILRPRHSRWSLTLSEFAFRINFISGIDNNVADALSRRSDYIEREDEQQPEALLPPSNWSRIGAITIHSTLLEENIDVDNDWPLLIAHWLATSDWPEGMSDDLLKLCRSEAGKL
jgi:hypothetical protein